MIRGAVIAGPSEAPTPPASPRPWAALLGATLLACTASATSRPPDHAEAALAHDLRVLCGRVAERSVSAWSQAVMETDEVRELTLRVDQGDEAARCELGRLMRAHAPRACEHTADSLAASCDLPGS